VKLLCLVSLFVTLCAAAQPITIEAGGTRVSITADPVRIAIEHDGKPAPAAHPESALLLGDPEHPEPASIERESFDSHGRRAFEVRTPSGKRARVVVSVTANQVDFVVSPCEPQAVLMRFAGVSPGFGLADHAAAGRPTFDTDVTGYKNDRFLSGQGLTRMVSNFIIYPQQHFAFVVWDPGVKIIRNTAGESLQGSRHVEREVRFTVFTGTPAEIYRQFLESRNAYGYPGLQTQI
jgi:hypothetical protein